MKKEHHLFLKPVVKQLFSIGILCLLSVFFSGCEAPSNPSENGKVSLSTTKTPVKAPEKSESSSPATVRLQSDSFPGVLILQSKKEEQIANGFRLPVFLENVAETDGLDTITLSMSLPEGVKLTTVDTPIGYTVQLDKLSTSTPTLHFYPFSSSGDSYVPVISSSDPIFTLEYSGKIPEKIGFSGLFFQTNGTLHRTPEQTLSF